MSTIRCSASSATGCGRRQARIPYGVEAAEATLLKSYDLIDAEMAGRTWAAGDAFTLADCAAAPPLFFANKLVPFGERHNLSAYFRRLEPPAVGGPRLQRGRAVPEVLPGLTQAQCAIKQRHAAGRDHLAGGAAQAEEAQHLAAAVGAHHQQVGALVVGVAEQRAAAGAARHGAGIDRVDRRR